MVDIYLQELLKGNAPFTSQNKKTKLEILIEREINRILKEYEEERPPAFNELESPAVRMQKMRLEIKKEIEKTSFQEQIESAIEILSSDIKDLEKEKINEIQRCFYTTNEAISTINTEDKVEKNVTEYLKISNDAITFIFELSVKKYLQGDFESCLSLFTLLAIFTQEDADNWYRAGIGAQMCEKFELALQLYSETIRLEPAHIGSKIFSTECLLKINEKTKALELYSQLKDELENESVEEQEKWKMAMSGIELYLSE